MNNEYITKDPIGQDFGTHFTTSFMINANLICQDILIFEGITLTNYAFKFDHKNLLIQIHRKV